MKNSNTTKMMQRVAALVLLLVGSITAAQADTKLYVEDFTINSGEEKKVAVCLDTDLSDICHVGFTVNLPSGLSFVKDGEKIKMSVESSRAGAAMSIESAWSNGKVIFSDLMRSTAISAGTGAVCYFYVEESGLASSAEITLSSVVLKRQDKSTVSDVVVAGGTVSKNGAVASGITMQFGENEVEFAPGETKNITVSMDNTGKNVQGFQTTLVLPTGWTAAVSSSRGTFTYNDATGKIVNQTGVTGSFGDLLNIALTAPTTFAGSAQVQLTDTKATVDFATVKIDDIAMTVTSSQTVATKPTVAFGGESIVIVPSKTGTIDVNMANNGMTVQGFQATLVLPAGWTAALSSSRGTFTYNDATGKILNYTGVSGEEGAMFTLTLTAPADFEGNAEVKLTNVKATVNNSSLKLDDISLTIYDKDAVAEQALADMKQALDDAKNEIATDYPAAATDEATATALSEAQDIIDALQAEMLEGIFDNVDAQKAALEAKVAEAKSLAAAVQAAADAEAAAQAAAADKLAELKAAAEVLAVSEEAKAYENDKVKAAVASAEEAITAAATAVAAVEAEIAKGELATTNKESLAAAVAAAEEAIATAQEAITAAEQTYATQKAAAEEAAASKEAYGKLAELKAAAEALAVSAEAKACENDEVKAAVAAAEEAIAAANEAVAAVEAKIAEGELATANKEALAEAITAAENAISAAEVAVAAAEEAYQNVPTIIPGDITGSGEVDADDLLQFQEDFLSGNYPKKGEDGFEVYDVNGDGKINIADMIAIQNLSLGLNIDGSDPADAARAYDSFDHGTLNVQTKKMDNGNTRIDLVLESTADYRAFQMDIVLPETMSIVAESANGLNVRSNNIGNTHRVIGYGKLQSGTVASFEIEGNGRVQFTDVVLATSSARAVYFDLGGTTGINAIVNGQASTDNCYDLSGRKVTKTQQRGIVIMDGRKVIMK